MAILNHGKAEPSIREVALLAWLIKQLGGSVAITPYEQTEMLTNDQSINYYKLDNGNLVIEVR